MTNREFNSNVFWSILNYIGTYDMM